MAAFIKFYLQKEAGARFGTGYSLLASGLGSQGYSSP